YVHFSYTFTPPAYLYTLSLHDALPIFRRARRGYPCSARARPDRGPPRAASAPSPSGGRSHHEACAADESPEEDRLRHLPAPGPRSEEHTSELQSRSDLVCRLLLEKKKK